MSAQALLLGHEQAASAQLLRALLPRHWHPRGRRPLGGGRGCLLQASGHNDENEDADEDEDDEQSLRDELHALSVTYLRVTKESTMCMQPGSCQYLGFG